MWSSAGSRFYFRRRTDAADRRAVVCHFVREAVGTSGRGRARAKLLWLEPGSEPAGSVVVDEVWRAG